MDIGILTRNACGMGESGLYHGENIVEGGGWSIMLPIEKFVDSVCGVYHSKEKIEKAMVEAKLQYRQGRTYSDILATINTRRQPCVTYGVMPYIQTIWHGKPKTYTELRAELCSDLDDVLRIDWGAVYGKSVPNIIFV